MSNKPRELSKAGFGLQAGLPLEVSGTDNESLARDLQRLFDLEAIKQVKHCYFRSIDTANWVELESILHPDLNVHYIGGGYELKMSSRTEFMDNMKQSFSNESVGRHHGHMPEIQMLSETEATGLWYLYDHFWHLKHNHLTHGTAIYADRYVKEDGRWMIRETSYERVYQLDESLAEKPRFSAHYLAHYGAPLS